MLPSPMKMKLKKVSILEDEEGEAVYQESQERPFKL